MPDEFRRSSASGSVGEPISPELVLVSPELRKRALAALPDRPWEAFLPVRIAVPAPTALSVAPPAAPPPRPESVPVAPPPEPLPIRPPQPLSVPPPPEPIPVPPRPEPIPVPLVTARPEPVAELPAGHGEDARSAPPVGGRRFWRAAVVPAAAAALMVVAISWASERTPVPHLWEEGAPERTTTTGENQPDAASTQPQEPASPTPLPSGGYVFAGGSMVADAKGANVEIVLTDGCGEGARTPPVPVDDGRFAYRGQVGKVKLAIRGSFVDERRARLRIEATGPKCAGPRSVDAVIS